MKIVNDLSINLGKNKWYNPNKLNSIDSILIVALLFVTEFILSLLVIPVKSLFKLVNVDDPILLELVMSLILQGSFFFIAFFYLKIRKVTPFFGGGYNKRLNLIDVIFSITLTLGIFLIFYSVHEYFYDYLVEIFGELDLGFTEEDIEKSNPIFVLIYEFIMVPVVPAICEELCFRGIVFRGLEERGPVFAVIVSGFLFALFHMSPVMFFLQFIGGIAFAAIVFLTKNHIYGCIMHFTHNLFSMVYAIIMQIGENAATGLSNVAVIFLILFGLVFLGISLLYFFKKYIKMAKSDGEKKESKAKEGDSKICYTTVQEADSTYYIKPYDFDDKELRENKDTLFLYNGSFISYNRKSRRNWLFWFLFSVVVGILFIVSIIGVLL